MIRFIDENRGRFGVEAICRVLATTERGFITSRGYRAAKRRAPSARSVRDRGLITLVADLHAANYSVYGQRKMVALLARHGHQMGRDQVARLMRAAGVRGASRSRTTYTTRVDPHGPRPTDLVKRQFTAPAPRRLWVVDITYVWTWAGFAYVAFVTDVFSRRVVGHNVAATLKASVLPLPALEMAAWAVGGDLSGLTHHSDHGSNYMSILYTDKLAELGAVPSTGTIGDSYDNALAEAVNGLYKTELIRRRGPWRTVEQVELETARWVAWWNHTRLHSELGMRTPIEVETAYYAGLESAQPATAGQTGT
jgi:transposase InsO family protein